MPHGTRPIGDPTSRCGQVVVADIDQALKLACELTGCPGPAFLRIDGVENSMKESNNPQATNRESAFITRTAGLIIASLSMAKHGACTKCCYRVDPAPSAKCPVDNRGIFGRSERI